VNINNNTTVVPATVAAASTSAPATAPQVFLNAFPGEPVTMQENPSSITAAPLPMFVPPMTQMTSPYSVPTMSIGDAAVPFDAYNNNSNNNNNNNNNTNNSMVVLNSEPQWGCLKSGNKPTFRSFHNKTCKLNTSTSIGSESGPVSHESLHDNVNNSVTANTSFSDNNNSNNNNSDTASASDSETENERDGPDPVSLSEVLYGSRQQRLNDYRNEQVKNDKKNIEPVIKIKQTKQRVVTKRYKLGKYTNKTGPVIGVLIKNVQTQRNVERKRNEMKHIPLDTIISRLHKKRLLKVGSSAPPDVLREMYESSMLAGDIENEGNDIALHNFLAGSTENIA
jgi:hypothetical protein